jgi:hypothetical protein
VPGDDEQGIVDADAQADQYRQARGQLRDAEAVAEQADDHDPAAQAEQRGEQRQGHGQQRAEGDEKDHGSAGYADDHSAGELGLAGRVSCLAGHLDIKGRVAGCSRGQCRVVKRGGRPVGTAHRGDLNFSVRIARSAAWVCVGFRLRAG